MRFIWPPRTGYTSSQQTPKPHGMRHSLGRQGLEIYITELDGVTNLRLLTTNLHQDTLPALSPDGKKLTSGQQEHRFPRFSFGRRRTHQERHSARLRRACGRW
jgi:Tol biopolymer transport system component